MKFKEYLNEDEDFKKNKAGVIPYVINNNKIEILCMVPSDPNYGGSSPQMSKGHIDGGENEETAALREMREELGITNYDYSFKLFDKTIKGMLRNYKISIFGVRLKNKKKQSNLDKEVKKIVWISEDDLFMIRKSQLPIIKLAVKKIKRKEKL